MAKKSTSNNKKTVYAVKHNEYSSPIIEDREDKKYVLWGSGNSYWAHLTDLYYNSPSNAACINGIFRLSYGEGLVYPNGDTPYKVFAKMPEKDLKKAMIQFAKTNKLVFQVDYLVTTDANGANMREIKGVFFMNGERVAPGKMDARGDIREYYYCKKDWNDNRTKKIPIPAFGFGGDDCKKEIFFYDKEHDSDAYYGPVDYQGGLQYCQLEIETSNYHLNLSYNGFTPSAIINLNNGVPDSEQQRRQVVNDILSTRTGSNNAGKIVVLFNDGSENAATFEPFNIPDAHQQYEFISREAMQKIFLAHNITSPLLLGIRDTGGGLGSNKEELIEAYNLFNLMVLEPMRQSVLSALKMIFPIEGQQLEFEQFAYFTEETNTVEPESNTQMKVELPSMSKDDEHEWIQHLAGKGEVIDDEYELLYETEVENADEEEKIMSDLKAKYNNMPNESDDNPQLSSKGDSGLFKVRYAYGPIAGNPDSRQFCKVMESFGSQGTVYRIEDIAQMSMEGVNGQFAPQGRAIYDIFRYKGGAYCHHRWYRRVYFRKRNNKGQFDPRSESPDLENDKRVSIASAERAGVPSSVLKPNGISTAEKKPIDMPNRGSLKNS